MYRSHTCGELRQEQIGQTVTLCGWVEHWRDHRSLVFIDLRDRYGVTQVKFDTSGGEKLQEASRHLRSEWVIQIEGVVASRPEGTVNPKLATGEIEIHVRNMEILASSKTPPFEPGAKELPGEDLRLRYRYLDLRRTEMQELLVLRHQLTKSVRNYFDEEGFLDIETPILGRSTPEGARDYLVPSRVNKGHFFALPQSPQIFKQLLMVGGMDRYIQIARCFRDEDLRADRQPEFTQIDVEMSFVEQDDILGLIDGMVARLMKDLRDEEITLPLPRMSHDEAIRRYGTDKPDCRFGLEIVEISDLVADSAFGVFSKTVQSDGHVCGLCLEGAADRYSRKEMDELIAWVGQWKARGLVWFRINSEGQFDSPTAKFFEPDQQRAIMDRMEAVAGDFLVFVADSFDVTSQSLAELRNRFGRELELYDPRTIHPLWVTDFPMFAWDKEGNRWVSEHHPFTMPTKEDLGKLDADPGSVRAQAYDLVVNGYEAGSGSIRIHDSQVQQRVFELLSMDHETAQSRFGFLLDALQYGAPPHGGIALGLDRWVMMFAGSDNIRDVIAFPKTQRAADLMNGAPSPVDDTHLRDLGIALR